MAAYWVFNADLLFERKSDMVPVREEIDDRRRSSCCQAYLRDGERVGRRENRSSTTCPNSKHEEKTIIDTRIWVQTSTSSRQPNSKLHRRNARCTHQRMQWSDTRSILLCMHVLPRHLAYWAVWRLFCWVEGRCCLATADQVSSDHDSATKLTSDKNMFGGGRRLTASVCTARTVSKDANFDAPCGGFDSFSSLGLFFSLETMYFELLFEVLALMFHSTFKTEGRC